MPRHSETKEDEIVLQSTVASDDRESDPSQECDGESAAPIMKRPAVAGAPRRAASTGELPVMKRPASRLANSATNGAKLPVVKSPVLKKPPAVWKKPSARVEEGDELCLDSQVPPHGDALPVKKLRALQYFSKFMRGSVPAALAPKKSSPQNMNVDAKPDVA